jgi:hypothetical protein
MTTYKSNACLNYKTCTCCNNISLYQNVYTTTEIEFINRFNNKPLYRRRPKYPLSKLHLSIIELIQTLKIYKELPLKFNVCEQFYNYHFKNKKDTRADTVFNYLQLEYDHFMDKVYDFEKNLEKYDLIEKEIKKTKLTILMLEVKLNIKYFIRHCNTFLIIN